MGFVIDERTHYDYFDPGALEGWAHAHPGAEVVDLQYIPPTDPQREALTVAVVWRDPAPAGQQSPPECDYIFHRAGCPCSGVAAPVRHRTGVGTFVEVASWCHNAIADHGRCTAGCVVEVFPPETAPERGRYIDLIYDASPLARKSQLVRIEDDDGRRVHRTEWFPRHGWSAGDGGEWVRRVRLPDRKVVP